MIFFLVYVRGIIPKRHNSCLNLLNCNMNILNLISPSHFLKQQLRSVGQFICKDFSHVGVRMCQATITSTFSAQLLRSQKTKLYFFLHDTTNKNFITNQKSAIDYDILPYSRITALWKNPDYPHHYFSGKKRSNNVLKTNQMLGSAYTLSHMIHSLHSL